MKPVDALFPLLALAVMYSLGALCCWMLSAFGTDDLPFRAHVTLGACISILAAVPVCLVLAPFYIEWRHKK